MSINADVSWLMVNAGPFNNNNIPWHDWGTGRLLWDIKSPWLYCLPIACPDFPDILDEDMFQLMYVLNLCQHQVEGISEGRKMLSEGELNLYHWAIVLASKRAIEKLDR